MLERIFSDKKTINGHSIRAGSSIIIHANLLSTKGPQLLEVCLPYGASYFSIKGKEKNPIAIHT